jgi:hypothetical protein
MNKDISPKEVKSILKNDTKNIGEKKGKGKKSAQQEPQCDTDFLHEQNYAKDMMIRKEACEKELPVLEAQITDLQKKVALYKRELSKINDFFKTK